MPPGEAVARGLLFTDLEGSTAHLRALGSRYAAVLARHHEIIRTAIAGEDGVEVGSEGDSFAVVFPGVAAAVRAAIVAQRGMLAAEWPDGPWSVRMAVHAGEVETGDAGAVGMALHEAARVRSVVHGGQIVLSDVARDAIDEPLPADVRLIDLGRHDIRDFEARVRLHQVAAAGLPTSFPPPRTTRRREIPADRTPFIGRGDELRAVEKLLEESPLVTIVGPGGSGKTRLAYEVGRRATRDTVVAVELAGIRDGEHVQAALLEATTAGSLEELRDRDILVVLDNCEHVVEAAAATVAVLGGGDVTVLATSREPLRVRGEHVWTVPVMEQDEAIALFRERAGVAVDDALVRTACERLARMPLAIELAAARARSIPLDQLISRLDDQLRVLTRGARDVPRHETLRATIDWSHDLLTEDERVVFRRLSVFSGGFELTAAETVAGEGADVLDALEGLVSKSLVELDVDGGRYSLLEPVRQYAQERLREAGEEDDVHGRHLRWVRRMSNEASTGLFFDPAAVNARLAAERDNALSAIGWALAHDDLHLASGVAVDMAWYWYTARRTDARAVLDQLLDRLDAMTPPDRAGVLRSAGMILSDDLDDPRPVEWLLESETITKAEGRERALGATLFWLGRSAAIRGQRDLAERAFTESIDLHDRLGNVFGWGWSMVWLAGFRRNDGDLDLSDRMLEEVLVRGEAMPHVLGAAFQELGKTAEARGDLAQAAARAAEATDVFRSLGDPYQIGMSEMLRGGLLCTSDLEEAATATAAAIRSFAEIEDEIYVGFCYLPAIELLVRAERFEQAAALAGACRGATAVNWQDFWSPNMLVVVADVEELLHDPAWTTAVERGRRGRSLDWAETAIGWLEEAYPASASTST